MSSTDKAANHHENHFASNYRNYCARLERLRRRASTAGVCASATRIRRAGRRGLCGTDLRDTRAGLCVGLPRALWLGLAPPAVRLA